MPLIDLNSTSGELRPGDRLVSRSSNGRILVIPDFNNSALQQLYEKSKEYMIPTTSEAGKIEVLTFSVYDHFKNKSDIDLPRMYDLAYVLQKQQGVCKDHAATLQILFQLCGIKSRYIKGYCDGEGHAWLKVTLKNGKDALIDPSSNFSGCSHEYEEFKKIIHARTGNLYTEDVATIIERD